MKPNSGLKGVDNRPFYDLDLLTKKDYLCNGTIVVSLFISTQGETRVFWENLLF